MLLNNFKYLNQIFDKILVLTISSADARRAHISKELEGLEFEFFYGVEKKNLKIADLLENKDITYHHEQAFSRQPKEFHEGTVACSWSHRNIYDHVLERGWNRVLILEDDISVSEYWKKKDLNAVFTTDVLDNDIIVLGHIGLKLANSGALLKRYYYALLHALHMSKWDRRSLHYIAHQCAQHLNENWVRPGQFFGTHAYGINPKSAEILRKNQTPIGFTADWLLNYTLLQTAELSGAILSESFFIQDIENLPSISN